MHVILRRKFSGRHSGRKHGQVEFKRRVERSTDMKAQNRKRSTSFDLIHVLCTIHAIRYLHEGTVMSNSTCDPRASGTIDGTHVIL